MGKPLTSKQEKFCQCVAMGKTYADSYRTAYDAENMADNSIYAEAQALLANPIITPRIDEIRSKDILYTKQQYMKDLDEARNMAKGLEKPETMIKADVEKAIANGIRVEKTENTNTNTNNIEIVVQTPKSKDILESALDKLNGRSK